MARFIRIRILYGIWQFDFKVNTIFGEFTDHRAMLLSPGTAVRTGFRENPRGAVPVNFLRIPVDLTRSQREDLGAALAWNKLITNQRLLLLHVSPIRRANHVRHHTSPCPTTQRLVLAAQPEASFALNSVYLVAQ